MSSFIKNIFAKEDKLTSKLVADLIKTVKEKDAVVINIFIEASSQGGGAETKIDIS